MWCITKIDPNYDNYEIRCPENHLAVLPFEFIAGRKNCLECGILIPKDILTQYLLMIEL